MKKLIILPMLLAIIAISNPSNAKSTHYAVSNSKFQDEYFGSVTVDDADISLYGDLATGEIAYAYVSSQSRVFNTITIIYGTVTNGRVHLKISALDQTGARVFFVSNDLTNHNLKTR